MKKESNDPHGGPLPGDASYRLHFPDRESFRVAMALAAKLESKGLHRRAWRVRWNLDGAQPVYEPVSAVEYDADDSEAQRLIKRAQMSHQRIGDAIGVAKPLSIYADLHDTGHVDTEKLEKVLMEVMNLSPRGIREHLQMNKPIYARTSSFGHFGREPDAQGGFSWEKTDLAAQLKSHFS